jgi:hypothetical protein
MSKIEDFTPEQWAIVDQRAAECSVLTYAEITPESLRPAVDALYRLFGWDPPEHIVIFESIKDLSDWQRKTKNTVSSDLIGVYTKIWQSHLEVALEIGALEGDQDTADLLSVSKLSADCYDSVVYKNGFCAVKLPHTCERDNAWELHCADGPAIAWSDQEVYAWHGVIVPRSVIMDPESLASGALKMTTEIRRAWAERLGWARALELLGATELSRQSEESLEYVLYSVPSGERVLSKQSPPLLDGSQPTYVEQVSSQCATALGARAWQVPYAALGLPERSPADCDADPRLSYVWER